MAFDISHGFAPHGCEDPSVLVLGTLPSVQSLERGEYYAHPRNAFWSIIESISDQKFGGNYDKKLAAASQLGVALWDVYRSAERPGSLDANIVAQSAEVNDFTSLLHTSSSLKLVACNGATSYTALLKHADIEGFSRRGVAVVKLPSTSPAYAAMSLETKCARWEESLRPYLRYGASR